MSLWDERDLPVLRALRETTSEHVRSGYLGIGGSQAADALGLELDDHEILDSMLALRDAGYVDFIDDRDAGMILTHLSVLGRGLQVLGEWPAFEAAVSPQAVALLLERLAPGAPTMEETGKLRDAATYVRTLAPGAFRQLAIGALNHYVRAQLGI